MKLCIELDGGPKRPWMVTFSLQSMLKSRKAVRKRRKRAKSIIEISYIYFNVTPLQREGPDRQQSKRNNIVPCQSVALPQTENLVDSAYQFSSTD